MPETHVAPLLILRIKGEYAEMPGLTLTLPQAQRLWALDRSTCEAALRGLVQVGFLVTTHAGAFVQASGQIVRERSAVLLS